MGVLVLVRHGQASLFSDDYDRLSALGERQARLLGEHWVARGERFDRMIAGPRRRQVGTARIVAEVYREAGVDLPEPEVVHDFDEMHAEELLRAKLPSLVEEHPSLRALVEGLGEVRGPEDALRRFQKIFESVMRLWIEGAIDAPEIEPWSAFCTRVAGAIDALRELRGARIAAFTSGGTIAASMRHALELSDRKTLDLASVVRNASITELAVSRGRVTPVVFNAIPHLSDPATVTHR